MSFEIRSDEVDVEQIMRQVRARIEEKRQGLYTDEELEEIARRRLDAVLDAHEFNSDLISDFRSEPARWNYQFSAETVYRSSRGVVGQILERIRRVLRPVQKLFWNPNPMISALSRQADLNRYYVHLFHSMASELTKLNLEVQGQKNRVLELQARLDLLARREKTLESMVVLKDEAGPTGGDSGGGASA
jgi:hypothetical protein